jgi:tRNA(adenine34) deaminase
MLALREAAQHRGHWRLTDCTLVVTLEPCPMCAGAIVNARIPRVVYGADDPKAGAVKTLYTICQDSRLNHRADVTSGVMAVECATLLQDFFRKQRILGKK